MLMPRDKLILKFLEQNKSATLQQITDIFFKGLYKSASRRLKFLESSGYLKSYINELNKQKAYYIEKKLSSHDLTCIDIYAKLIKIGATILDFRTQFQENNKLTYLKGLIKPDAYLQFSYNSDEYYEIFLEVDLNHYTNRDKMILYEKLNREEFENEMPTLLILRPTEGIRYKSNTIDVFYEDIDINTSSIEQLFPKI